MGVLGAVVSSLQGHPQQHNNAPDGSAAGSEPDGTHTMADKGTGTSWQDHQEHNNAPENLAAGTDIVSQTIQMAVSQVSTNQTSEIDPSASSSQAGTEPDEEMGLVPASSKNEGLDASSSRNDIPCLDLLYNEVSYRLKCMPLRTAAMKGDWIAAKPLLFDGEHHSSSMLRMAVTKQHETVLHVAAGARQIKFVRKIINFMDPDDLRLKDEKENTAFFRAAATGCVQIAKAMLQINEELAKTKNIYAKTPLYDAVLYGREEMAMLLYDKTKSYLTEDEKAALFSKSIETDLYGLALKLLKENPKIAMIRRDECRDPDEARECIEDRENPLLLLAKKSPSVYTEDTNFTRKKLKPTQALQLLQKLWKKVLLHGDNDIIELIRRQKTWFLFNAAKSGNSPFLAELIRFCPDAVLILDETGLSIFHIAILHRQTSVFNLINDIGFAKDVLATKVNINEGNNMLHLAAEYPEPRPISSLSNAALEMQQELILFKEIEKIVIPSYRAAKNADDLTPRELFTMSHSKLVQSGAKWMKSTASSCMLVATLIATVVFSAAFTVPGGNDDKTGMPRLLKTASFRVFAISDAIALSSSSFSILMFLSIITSGFPETDFHRSLPLKLVIGILALFVSVISMMVTFSSSYFLVYRDRSNSIPILCLIFVTVPITLFVLLQYSLLREVFLLTYRSGLLNPLHIRFHRSGVLS